MKSTKLGRYDLVGVIGDGAMGFVYEAFDPNLKRRVAIKTIKVENLSAVAAQEYEARFRTEAQSAARLQHPNIVSVYDSDRDDGVAFLVMEFVEGEDLKQHLSEGKIYSLRETVAIMVALLSALEYSHSQKIIHRDVKPANLLIATNGHVKLTDFGVARIQDSGDATRTQGTVVGTLKYMSPEQIQGLPVDARADLFAAGVILYQLLTGIRPFDAETDFGVIQKIVSITPESATLLNPQLPPEINAVVAKALAKSRDDRYSSAAEFSNALTEACRHTESLDLMPELQTLRNTHSSTSTIPVELGSLAPKAAPETLGVSPTVTQEIELIYWKEIKDTTDDEDLSAFLTQFPNGIYAALAHRRRRQLSDLDGTTTPVITPVSEHGLVASAVTNQRQGQNHSPLTPSEASPGNVTQGNHGSRTQPSNARSLSEFARIPAGNFRKTGLTAGPAPEVTADRQNPTRSEIGGPVAQFLYTAAGTVANYRWAAGFAVIALMSVAAYGLKARLTVPLAENVQTTELAESTSEPLRKTNSLSAPPAEDAILKPVAAFGGSTPAPKPNIDPKMAVASPKSASSKPMTAGKNDAAARPTKPVAEDTFRSQSADPTRSAPEAPQQPTAVKPASRSLQQMCEDRILLGYQTCMQEQCQKSVFFNHALCVERRAFEQRRREQELYR